MQLKGLLLAAASAACLAVAVPACATINSPQVTVVDSGNGATTNFNYPFLIPFQANGVTPAVTVQLQDSVGNVTLLSPTQYSITGVGNPAGGNVHYPLAGSALPTGSTITISRNLAYIQPNAVANQGFLPHTTEIIADNLDAQIQQLAAASGRAILFPPPENSETLPPAVVRSNTFLGFDAGGVIKLYGLGPAPGTADAFTTTYTAPYIGATLQSVGGKLAKTVSVTDFGAVGGNAALDTLAFQNAIAAACTTAVGTGGVFEVDVPVLASGYSINASLNVCTNLHIHGVGGIPVVNFSPAGSIGSPASLFTNAGQDNVEIDHLDMEGTDASYAFGYRAVSNASSALNLRLHDNFFNHWGDGTHGAWVSIESDSGANAIYNNYGVAKTANINIIAPTDRMHIYDNLLSSTNGTCIVGASPVSGASTVLVDHNIFECELGGAVKLNTLGEWIVNNNEEETLNAITNADSAIYDFQSVTLMAASNNSSNSHAGANFDFYIGNAVTNSRFGDNTGVTAVTSVFRVGSGLGNIYNYNNSGNGPSHVYNADYPGIRTNQLYGGKGIAQGCGITTTGIIPNTFCREIEELSPGTSTTANGIFLTPSLASGNIAAFVVGQDFSTGNAAEVDMFWNGNNNAANRVRLALNNGQPLSVDISGNTSTPGTINSTAGFKANGTVGVSCAANTVNLTTLVVTLGVVTHC